MTTYEALSIIFQIVIAIAGFATLFIYFNQLRVMSSQLTAMQESSKAQSGLSLVSFLQSAEVRAARQVVRGELSKKPLQDWSAEERHEAALVVANYDVVAALLRAGMAPVKLISDNWGPSIKHCYEVLKPFIEEQRNLPGGCSTYWSNFDWLYKEAYNSRL